MTSSTESSPPLGAAAAALEWVQDGMTLGLGTGRAASAFVEALGARVAGGLQVTGVPTSEATAELAGRLAIPLARLEDIDRIDITFDGADEVDPQLDLIKGYGAAMVREKIVAASSDRLVILVGPEKRVSALGERGRLPIEVLPFGEALVRRELDRIGIESDLRPGSDGAPLVTDNGHWILDARLSPPSTAVAPADLEAHLVGLPGVLGTGFFLGMTDAVIIGDRQQAEILRKS